MPERKDPLTNGYFYAEFGENLVGSFKSADGISLEVEVVRLQQQEKGKTVITHNVGNPKLGNITLKRGLTDNKQIWDWIEKAAKTPAESRVNGSITLYNTEDVEQVRLNMTNAWPCRADITALDSESSAVLLEEVELTFEAIAIA